MFDQIIDANINRLAEGLRCIEEYVRFVANHHQHAQQLADMRKKASLSISQSSPQLNARDTFKDTRAKEAPRKRTDIKDLLLANFKRVTESCRVLEEYTGKIEFNHIRYDCYELEKEIILNLLKPEIITPGIYLISDDPDVLKYGIKHNVSLIQLRDKHATKEEIYNKCKTVCSFLTDTSPPFIINDHLDIALSLDADGLHTGQDDIDISIQRKLLGPHKLIGRTTSNLNLGLQAKKESADYVSAGPIWETPSKPGRACIGFDYLKEAAKLDIPYVAIGGINKENIESVLEHKPPLVAVIRAYKDIPSFDKLIKANSKTPS